MCGSKILWYIYKLVIQINPLPQGWGRSWWRFRLGVHTCSHQWTVLIYLKYIFRSSSKTYFFILDFFLHWSDHRHKSWNFSFGVFESFPWYLPKPYTFIFYHHRLYSCCGEGVGCVISLVIINLLNVAKTIIPRFNFSLFCIFVLSV